MKKNEIIKAVENAIKIDTVVSTNNFTNDIKGYACILSTHVILTSLNSNVISYLGNYGICRQIAKQNQCGKIRHSVDYYWQGNAGCADIMKIIRSNSDVKILRFSVAKDELPSTISALQTMLKQKHLLAQSDDTLTSAYVGNCKTARLLQKRFKSNKSQISKYANFWLWQVKCKNLSLEMLENIVG